jgi:hypothetical protein
MEAKYTPGPWLIEKCQCGRPTNTVGYCAFCKEYS